MVEEVFKLFPDVESDKNNTAIYLCLMILINIFSKVYGNEKNSEKTMKNIQEKIAEKKFISILLKKQKYFDNIEIKSCVCIILLYLNYNNVLQRNCIFLLPFIISSFSSVSSFIIQRNKNILLRNNLNKLDIDIKKYNSDLSDYFENDEKYHDSPVKLYYIMQALSIFSFKNHSLLKNLNVIIFLTNLLKHEKGKIAEFSSIILENISTHIYNNVLKVDFVEKYELFLCFRNMFICFSLTLRNLISTESSQIIFFFLPVLIRLLHIVLHLIFDNYLLVMKFMQYDFLVLLISIMFFFFFFFCIIY
jgi:hypothetical protein